MMPKTLKSYSAPWEGRLSLACKKCQKKLKGNDDLRALAKLKKTVNRLNKEHPDRTLHVIGVTCMKVCPKNGVTVCRPLEPRPISILRNEADVERLYD